WSFSQEDTKTAAKLKVKAAPKRKTFFIDKTKLSVDLYLQNHHHNKKVIVITD
ncbi:MAG: hypothetical protein RLZZ252_1927, partial [Bacteroidota bacterium]